MLSISKPKSIWKELKYGTYLATHPMDGLWDLKHAGKGSIRAAVVLVLLFFLSSLAERQLTAWQFNANYIYELNVFIEFFTGIGPFAMWCVSAWCVTSLLEGQGTLKDICKATAYSLVPLIICKVLGVVVSNVIVSKEYMIYSILQNVGLLWSLGLIFLSVVSIHQYTVGKAVFVTLLSILGILVMAVLGILLYYLMQQMISFGLDIVKEYGLRITE